MVISLSLLIKACYAVSDTLGLKDMNKTHCGYVDKVLWSITLMGGYVLWSIHTQVVEARAHSRVVNNTCDCRCAVIAQSGER